MSLCGTHFLFHHAITLNDHCIGRLPNPDLRFQPIIIVVLLCVVVVSNRLGYKLLDVLADVGFFFIAGNSSNSC